MKNTVIILLVLVLAAIGVGVYMKKKKASAAAAAAAADPGNPDTKPSNTTSAPSGTIRVSADIPIVSDTKKAAL